MQDKSIKEIGKKFSGNFMKALQRTFKKKKFLLPRKEKENFFFFFFS